MTLEPREDGEMFAYVFKTRADPFAGRINLFRVYQGVMKHDTQVLNTRAHSKERIGQLLVPRGKEVSHTDAFGPGDIGAVAKLKETRAGDWLAARDQPISMPSIRLPAPVMAFAMEPASKGDEDKVFTALRRLQEEDPTIDLHRDPQTGEQIVAGLSQMHVEVVIDLVDMKAYEYADDGNCKEIPIPDDLADRAQEYREKLMDEVAENSEALMERYLEGEEISHDEIVTALEDGTDHGHIFPVTCGVATSCLASNRLLDAIVDDLPSPAKVGALSMDGVRLEPDETKDTVAFVFKTLADPYAGRINLFRVYQGVMKHDSQAIPRSWPTRWRRCASAMARCSWSTA